MGMVNYPSVRAGEPADDPYRWLEADTPEVGDFVRAQNAFAEPILAALPGREWFRETVAGLLGAPTRGCPWRRGDRFFAWQGDGQNQDVLVVADSVAGLEGGRMLLDPNAMSSDGTVAVSASSVSPDGSLVAYCVADGGSDWWTIRIRDVATGADLPDVVDWAKWHPPVWHPGGRAFSYWAYDPPTGSALLEEQGAGRLLRHEVGGGDEVLFERPEEPRLFVDHGPRDDEWFVLATSGGSSQGNDLRARRWESDEWRQVVEGLEDEWSGVGVREGSVYCVTDHEAPRYRLVAIDLSSGERRVVVPEHEADVLLGARLTASGLVLWYSSDASHRLQVASFEGALGDVVPVGEGVSVRALQATTDSSEFYVATTSFTDPGTRHVVVAEGPALVRHEELPTPGVAVGAVGASSGRIWATSADGTRVPAFVVQKGEVDGPRPTLIWAYGGFNIPMNPAFRPVLAAWVEAGGVLVVPNLRGGGEFGREWHEAGTKERKQNVFDDLYAVAGELVASGRTTNAQLALHGRSNGGLLAGAALTQRPEMWAAVLPGVGVLDMMRFHKHTIGWAWIADYGDPDAPAAAEYLRAYSPLHNVRAGVAYPPTLITTGDHDDRVVPSHSFKFAAALQAQASGGAIVLSVDTRAGHGAGKPRDAQAIEFADQLAFAAHHTGLVVPPEES